ncbi:gag-pol polyprotein [Cucumis melo var. makuwa]|uniref:Gag-pol polyprotein n=1 Tax=Cucumis melo var. makuwa TaxID=1194695 RepID=A0A5D3CGP4_CUCMM|nr:gag-pol polyprotein [Cucumis melo var. makuwa]
MENLREGCSTKRPPLLDGANYEHWKAQMMAFMKSLNLNCSRALMAGWEQPTETNKVGMVTPKIELKWSKAEDEVVIENCQALNALFNAVDLHVFKLINICTFAKEAWDIVKVAYEGTFKVKTSRL